MAVGVSYATLLKWGEGEGKTGRKVSKKVAVATSARIVLVTPDGFRIEADNPKDIVVVLRGLR